MNKLFEEWATVALAQQDAQANYVMRQARGSDFRTAPLWGLRLRERFLHDGRARSVHQAIALHGGEASIIRDRYLRTAEWSRRALLSFLRTL